MARSGGSYRIDERGTEHLVEAPTREPSPTERREAQRRAGLDEPKAPASAEEAGRTGGSSPPGTHQAAPSPAERQGDGPPAERPDKSQEGEPAPSNRRRGHGLLRAANDDQVVEKQEE